MKRQRKIPVKQDCSMEITINLISGKWKPAIITALLRGRQRPKDLQAQCPEATKRVINQQLKELEEDGIVTKKIYDELPIRVEYYLTPLGKELTPVVKALTGWGDAYKKKTLSKNI
jgi:DNA-binding HxlR family transcriptional regulator